jgi:hypothetical protein
LSFVIRHLFIAHCSLLIVLIEFMPPDEAVRVGEIFAEIAADRQLIVDLENRNLTKDGDEIVLLTNGVPILDSEGYLLGYRGVDKDITERKRAEAETQRHVFSRFPRRALPSSTLNAPLRRWSLTTTPQVAPVP